METAQTEKKQFIHANLAVGDTFRSYSGFIFVVERVGEYFTDIRREDASETAPAITYQNEQLYDEIESGEIEPVAASEFIKNLYGEN